MKARKFKLDENLPGEIVTMLRDCGHDAMTVIEKSLGGHPDTLVAHVCRQERRTLITLDMNFADIRTYPPCEYPGFVVLRPASQERRRVLELFQRIVSQLSRERLNKTLWIVDEGVIRVREGI